MYVRAFTNANHPGQGHIQIFLLKNCFIHPKNRQEFTTFFPRNNFWGMNK